MGDAERQPGPAKGTSRRGVGRIRQERSGKFSAAYIGPDNVLHRAPNTFEAKVYAEGWLAGERRLIELGAWQPPQRRALAIEQARAIQEGSAKTLRDFAEAWLQDKRNRDPDDRESLRPTTAKDYRTLLDRHILPTLGDLPVAQITPEAVHAWHKRLGANKTPRARAKAYSLLTGLLNAAVADKSIPLAVNPCQIKGASKAKPRKEVEPVSLDELDLIVAAMPRPLQLAVELAVWCALRYGEVFELRRGDVVFSPRTGAPKSGSVRVRRGVVWVAGQTYNDKPKTKAGIRDVAIPPHILGHVVAHLAEFVGPEPDSLVFTSRTGSNLRPSSFEGPWQKARKAAGRDDLTFHGLRHSGAVLAAQSGATIAELQARLGHATPAMAMHYQHAAQGRDQVIAEQMSRLARG